MLLIFPKKITYVKFRNIVFKTRRNMTPWLTLLRVFHIICADKHLNENSRIHTGVLSHSPDKSVHHISFCQRENAWYCDRRNWTRFLFKKNHYQYFFVTNPISETVNMFYLGMVNFSNKKRNIRCLEQKLWKICKKVSVLRLEMML